MISYLAAKKTTSFSVVLSEYWTLKSHNLTPTSHYMASKSHNLAPKSLHLTQNLIT